MTIESAKKVYELYGKYNQCQEDFKAVETKLKELKGMDFIITLAQDNSYVKKEFDFSYTLKVLGQEGFSTFKKSLLELLKQALGVRLNELINEIDAIKELP